MNTYLEKRLGEFEGSFCKERICKACLHRECRGETTGCPWYQNTVLLNSEGGNVSTEEQLKSFLEETAAQVRALTIAECREVVKEMARNIPVYPPDDRGEGAESAQRGHTCALNEALSRLNELSNNSPTV